MNKEDKETDDWLAILSGKSVPDASPEIIREAQALRMELNFRKEQALQTEPEFCNPPNPQILKNVFKATGLGADEAQPPQFEWLQYLKDIGQKIISDFLLPILRWKLTLPLPVAATVALLLVIAPLVIQPLIISEPEPNIIGTPKTLSAVSQELTVSNPQAKAEALIIGLAKLDIVVTVVTEEEVWIIEVTDLSTANPAALATLLQKHELKRLPPPMANQLNVQISAK